MQTTYRVRFRETVTSRTSGHTYVTGPHSDTVLGTDAADARRRITAFYARAGRTITDVQVTSADDLYDRRAIRAERRRNR